MNSTEYTVSEARTSEKPRTPFGKGLRTLAIIRGLLGSLVYVAFAAFYVISYMNGEGEPLMNIGLAALNAVGLIVHLVSLGLQKREAKQLKKSMKWWTYSVCNNLQCPRPL